MYRIYTYCNKNRENSNCLLLTIYKTYHNFSLVYDSYQIKEAAIGVMDSILPDNRQYTRKHIRLELHDAVMAQLRVVGLNGHPVHTPSRKVLLLDLSAGGARFATTLVLPSEAKWEVALRFALEGMPLEVKGAIVWSDSEYHWREYGVAMNDDPLMCTLITRALNQRILRMSPALYRIHRQLGSKQS